LIVRASVIIRSKDEADRLRLTLASLASQTEKPEVVVVNDGSSDHTAEVVADSAGEMDLKVLHHVMPAGRSAAANAGAASATGDVLIFLDGDTLAAPDLVARHMGQHRSLPNLVVRGETWHLRCTRPFLDPEAGTPRPGEEARVLRMPEDERVRSRVSREEIRKDFGAIESRAQPGIYPGFGPRKLLEQEMHALRSHPGCTVLWAAASGSNQSVDRRAFMEAGGFHPELSINEHREVALRLCNRGLRMASTSARSYHMIHRSGWRDPLLDTAWEDIFYDAHPIAEVALLPFFWASLSDAAPFPAQACIRSLPELAAAAEGYRAFEGLKSVRDAHLRATLGAIEIR
jgi:glycosyltransferase involved in cell wall biosynthesis